MELPANSLDLPAIPGFQITREHGRGGMGVVYEAQRQADNLPVALKLIRDNALASPQDRARLRIEAEAAARLEHPNIVRLLEVGEYQGHPYLVMEFIRGRTLDESLGDTRVPAKSAAQLICTLARALQHMHERNIVHRDLKPANILMKRIDDSFSAAIDLREWQRDSVPMITDFGLAKRLDSESTAWTQAGNILGTVSYMAPEQAAGRVDDIGPAADIHALGVILYELLTGRLPFEADSFAALIEQVINNDPPLPSRFCNKVPGALEAICLKCLEKLPERRYASADELARDLEQFLADAPVAATSANEHERLARRAARDGYTLLEQIGTGRHSRVFRATYGPLEQPVVVKVLSKGICDEDEWNRRLQEGATIWATLTHPQIVLARQAGWWDGNPFVATEYIPQGSLASALATQPFSLASALQLAEQLLEVVCYLHRQGVVHGNIKPSNILLAAGGIPRLADIRLLSGLSFGQHIDSRHLGTEMHYIAPELLADPSADPRPLADVYGVGAVLYELLAGEPPFADVDFEATIDVESTIVPNSITARNERVPPALEWLCFRCLRRKPWLRYSRAYDLLVGVRKAMEDLEL